MTMNGASPTAWPTPLWHSASIFDMVRPLRIAPSILSADFARLGDEVRAVDQAGADTITVHAEAGPHLDRSLQTVKALGKKAGVALNPGTPIDHIRHVLDRLDLILIMTVNPGFGGQSFIAAMIDKIRETRDLVSGRNIDIEVDGGITAETAPLVVKAGANALVTGSAVFKGDAKAYARNIAAIRTGATSLAA